MGLKNNPVASAMASKNILLPADLVSGSAVGEKITRIGWITDPTLLTGGIMTGAFTTGSRMGGFAGLLQPVVMIMNRINKPNRGIRIRR
jgi:hypothetical protein